MKIAAVHHNHILYVDTIKWGLVWFLLPKMFSHILCEDEEILCVFHIPNWVKRLNWNLDNTNFRYMRWEQSSLLLHHFSCVIAEK